MLNLPRHTPFDLSLLCSAATAPAAAALGVAMGKPLLEAFVVQNWKTGASETRVYRNGELVWVGPTEDPATPAEVSSQQPERSPP